MIGQKENKYSSCDFLNLSKTTKKKNELVNFHKYINNILFMQLPIVSLFASTYQITIKSLRIKIEYDNHILEDKNSWLILHFHNNFCTTTL